LEVIQTRLTDEKKTKRRGGRFLWKTTARDAYLILSGKKAFTPTAWISAKDCLGPKYSSLLTALNSDIYRDLKETLNLHD